MRLDKYLKVSRIIKRRTVANEACSGACQRKRKGCKASTEVKAGDILEIRFGEKVFKAQILSIAEHVSKSEAPEMYKVLN